MELKAEFLSDEELKKQRIKKSGYEVYLPSYPDFLELFDRKCVLCFKYICRS